MRTSLLVASAAVALAGLSPQAEAQLNRQQAQQLGNAIGQLIGGQPTTPQPLPAPSANSIASGLNNQNGFHNFGGGMAANSNVPGASNMNFNNFQPQQTPQYVNQAQPNYYPPQQPNYYPPQQPNYYPQQQPGYYPQTQPRPTAYNPQQPSYYPQASNTQQPRPAYYQPQANYYPQQPRTAAYQPPRQANYYPPQGTTYYPPQVQAGGYPTQGYVQQGYVQQGYAPVYP